MQTKAEATVTEGISGFRCVRCHKFYEVEPIQCFSCKAVRTMVTHVMPLQARKPSRSNAFTSARAPNWMHRSGVASTQNSGPTRQGELHESVELHESGDPRTDDDTVKATRACDLEPEIVQRVSTGFAPLDRALGGGAVRGTVILLAGMPGAGKSTLLAMVSDRMQEQGEEVVYAAGEEPPERVVARTQAGNSGRTPRFWTLRNPSMEDVTIEADRVNASVVVIDSGSVTVSERMDDEHADPLIRVCQRAYRYAQSRGAVVFVVGHATAEGGMAGATRAKHWVDALVWVQKHEADPNIIEIGPFAKNRFGDVSIKTYALMGDAGDFGKLDALAEDFKPPPIPR